MTSSIKCLEWVWLEHEEKGGRAGRVLDCPCCKLATSFKEQSSWDNYMANLALDVGGRAVPIKVISAEVDVGEVIQSMVDTLSEEVNSIGSAS